MKPQWQKQNEANWAQQKRLKDMAYYQQQMQRQPPLEQAVKGKSNDEFSRVEQEMLELKSIFNWKDFPGSFDQALKNS